MPVLSRRRIVYTTGVAAFVGLLLSPGWKGGFPAVFVRALGVGVGVLLVFGTFERWPSRLPRWLPRWVLQVIGVGLAVPLTTCAIYVAVAGWTFWVDQERFEGWANLTIVGMFLAPWSALGALVRQKDALAQRQALGFALERSELERRALEARLRLLQAQVAPHFLFNSLANVQALVDAGSPQASKVLRSLTAYLRATVPRLDEQAATFDDELRLVQAYLELMHLRIPDRLEFALHVDDDARALRCPPITLLTLVENAVHHGIDPSEEGGRIDVHVQRHGERCLAVVVDTGVGLGGASAGLGTGLSTLRERVRMIFGDSAELRVRSHEPRGVCAELDLPAVAA